MGKAARIKAIRADEKAKPTIVNTISFNMLSDGGVNVSGPIQEPRLVIDILGKAFNALSQYYAQEAQKSQSIIKPVNGLILPH